MPASIQPDLCFFARQDKSYVKDNWYSTGTYLSNQKLSKTLITNRTSFYKILKNTLVLTWIVF